MQMDILVWIATNIIGQPALLLGIIAFLGLLLQKKPAEDLLSGTIKVMIGLILMSLGAGIFVEAVLGYQAAIAGAFGVSPPAAPGVDLGTFIGTYTSYAALIMAIGFGIHLILSAFTWRIVYLTGHLMWWVSVTVLATLMNLFPAADIWSLVIVGSIVMAIYWTIQPKYIDKYMQIVMGSDEIAYGHTSSIAAYLGALLAPYLGSPEESTEKISVPKGLSWLKDIGVSTTVVIGIILMLAVTFCPYSAIQSYVEGAGVTNVYIWALLMALNMAGGILVLLTGVRMFIGEIVPAFKGISEKVLPGAKPALDCPVVFPQAPTAVLVGFLASTFVFLLFLVIFASTGFFVLVPPMIMLFFPGGAAGVFGNSRGGWKGAVLGGAINGLFLAVGQAVTWPMLINYAPELATLADPDWYIIIWILYAIGSLVKAITGG